MTNQGIHNIQHMSNVDYIEIYNMAFLYIFINVM